MAYYFPETFGNVTTQIGSCAEHYNNVYSFEYFDRLVKQTDGPFLSPLSSPSHLPFTCTVPV